MYDDFVIEEKWYSKKFMEINQIDDRFDEDDYLVIKALFNDSITINKILFVIDDLVKTFEYESRSRYLILGDFIFSMGSLNLDDPANLVLKTSRCMYISNITERAYINISFGYDLSEYVNLHKKLLLGLRGNHVLERSIFRIHSDEWETVVYFKLNIENNIEYIMPLGISKFSFKISLNGKYSIGSFRNIWKLKRKKREMQDYPICLKSVIRSNNMKFMLDNVLYEINKNIINKEKNKLLSEVECNNLEEFLIKLKSIVVDSRYNNRNSVNKFNDIITIDLKDNLKKILQNYQKIIPFIILNRDIINKCYYLPCFIDNRGRQYFGTLLSPTFYKIFRYLYRFVENKKFEKLEESVYYRTIMTYSDTVSKFNMNKINTYLLIVLFIELGKYFIKSENNHFIKTRDIIQSGISNYLDQKIELNFDDTLYINKIKFEISKLLDNKEVDINTIIFKDATASGLQNYGILLGYREDMLKYLNLDGNDWCDTYKYLIDKFIDKDEKKLLKRKYWKSTIMTIPYNSVWYSCFIKFIEMLREDGIEYNLLDIYEKNRIKNLHKKFYDDMKNNMKKEFFKNNEGKFIDFKYDEWKIRDKKDYKITYKKLRDKYSDIVYNIIEDKEGSFRAREANNMHYLDAKLVKKIFESFDIIAIHDCFGIRLCELHLVIDNINLYYSKIIGKNTYSIHIIK